MFQFLLDYSVANVLKFTGVMVGFQSASYNVTESNSYIEVMVVKQGLSDVNVTVLLRTEDRTARGECKFGFSVTCSLYFSRKGKGIARAVLRELCGQQ